MRGEVYMRFEDIETDIIYEIVYDEFQKKYYIYFYHPKIDFIKGWITGARGVKFWKSPRSAINFLKKRCEKGRLIRID
jgi:hypothetical protein